jgi:hypothetical protein
MLIKNLANNSILSYSNSDINLDIIQIVFYPEVNIYKFQIIANDFHFINCIIEKQFN